MPKITTLDFMFLLVLIVFSKINTANTRSSPRKRRQDSVPDNDDEDQNLLDYSSDDIDSEEDIDPGHNEKLDQEKAICSDPGEDCIAFFSLILDCHSVWKTWKKFFLGEKPGKTWKSHRTVFKIHVGQGNVKENMSPPIIFTPSTRESTACTGICYLFQVGLLTHATIRSLVLSYPRNGQL